MLRVSALRGLVLFSLAGCAAAIPEPHHDADRMTAAPLESEGIKASETELEPEVAAWSVIASHGAPAGREDHTAIWTGSEMIVWGGEVRDEGVTALDSGARYDPVEDRWISLPAEAAPDRRDDHTVVWTGREMIVWGGNQADEDSELLASGGRYDPRSDRWAPTAAGPLSPRDDPTAIWTGREMIVWGGRTLGRVHVGSGAMYRPQTDEWLGLPTQGAPSPREDHTAVWTGSEMIVWGGWSGPDDARRHFADGGRFDPESGRWRTMSTEGAPEPREDHTAVWTGAEMLVWGGVVHRYDGDEDMLVQLATGGRYDPVTDSWQPMTLDMAPAPREDHVALWIGEELLVWGGRSGTRMLRDGARYSPRDDRWRAMDMQPDGPAARWNHTGVVAGEEVLIWGGFADGYDAGGARYRL